MKSNNKEQNIEVKSRLWSLYYSAEKELFKYVRENSEVITELNPPEYIVKVDLNLVTEQAPNYVRGIYQLKTKENDEIFIELLNSLKKTYKNALLASKKAFNKYPARTAVFYSDLNQINLSSHNAYESLKLKEDTNFGSVFTHKIKSREDLENTKEFIEELQLKFKLLGIKTSVIQKLDELCLYLNVDDIFKYAKTKNIQARRLSGTQYRALIRFNGDSKGYRKNYGFMVLESNSTCNVFTSNPEALRPHSLELSGKQISFGDIDNYLIYTFYKK